MFQKILNKLSFDRFQTYLDTGYYPDESHSKTWDMLVWLDSFK